MDKAEQPTITQADIELWRAGNAAALDAAGFVTDADLCRRGQFDNLPTAKAFQQEIANTRTTSLAAQDGLVEAEIDRRVAEERAKLLARLREPTSEMVRRLNAACDTPDVQMAWVFPYIATLLAEAFQQENSDER